MVWCGGGDGGEDGGGGWRRRDTQRAACLPDAPSGRARVPAGARGILLVGEVGEVVEVGESGCQLDRRRDPVEGVNTFR